MPVESPERRARRLAAEKRYRETHRASRRAACRHQYRKNRARDNARRTDNRRQESPAVRARRLQKLREYYHREKAVFISKATLRQRKLSSACEAGRAREWMRAVLSKPLAACYYCRSVVLTSQIEFDHVIPLSKGGEHSVANLCVACIGCNRSKHDHLLPKWPKCGQLFLPL